MLTYSSLVKKRYAGVLTPPPFYQQNTVTRPLVEQLHQVTVVLARLVTMSKRIAVYKTFFVPNDLKNALSRSGHYVAEHSVYKCDVSLGLWNIQIVTGWCSGNAVIRILDTFGAYHDCFIAIRD